MTAGTPSTKAKNPTWIVVAVLVFAIVIVALASRILYDRTVELLTENLRERILTISITAAASINAADLAALHKESDWTRPEWARVVNMMHRAKYSNDAIVFMYIFRKQAGNPEEMEFVADADSINPYTNTDGDEMTYVDVNRDGLIEPDGPDKLQWPGQPYPEAVDIPEAWAAYDGPLTSADLYTDSYGTVLTGYAPIKDDRGTTVAVLATDIKADDFSMITTQTFRPFLLFLLSLMLVIVFLTLVIFHSWRTYADSFQHLNDELQHMNTRLKDLDHMKSQFLSFASHQLKAPMTSVKWTSSLIADGSLGKVPKEVTDAAHEMEHTVDQLVGLVNEFLDLRLLEEGRMDYRFEPTDAAAMVSDIAHQLKANAEHRGLTLTFKSSAKQSWVMADRRKLSQVYTNLVDNSIKYTDTGSVAISVTNDDDKTVTVSISDTGHGIDKELLPNLFEEFNRDRKDAKRIEGTGLGLYIAKQIMAAHNGRIWAESEGRDKGSTFRVVIPLTDKRT